MGFGAAEGVTPGRETRVVLGEFPITIQQPFFGMERSAAEIGRGNLAKQQNVEYIAGIGYRLRSYALNPSAVYELEAAQAAILKESDVQVADHHEGIYISIKPTLLGLVYYGAAVLACYMFQKRNGNNTFEARLTADQTAHPSPKKEEDIADMDRVCVSTEPHNPDELLTFRFYLPSSSFATTGPIISLMFSGPAGVDTNLLGFGQYAMKVFGNGETKLFERGKLPNGEIDWVERAVLGTANLDSKLVVISVLSNATETCQTGWSGDRIAIMCPQFPAQKVEETSLLSSFGTVSSSQLAQQTYIYKVPKLSKAPVQVAPVRIDVRRDIRAYFQISKTQHPASGILVDEPFSVPFHPVAGTGPFQVEWYCDSPKDTSVDVKMFRADTDAELSGTTVTVDCLGGVKRFAVPDGYPNTYYLKFIFSGDGKKTPTLTYYRVFKSAVLGTPYVPTYTFPQTDEGLSLPKTFGSEYSVTGAGEDPQEENATIKIYDLANAYSEIRNQSGTPCAIKVYDTEDNLLSVVHRGIIARATSHILVGEDEFTYPAEDAYMLDLTTKGEWERAKRQLAPRRLSLWDATNGKAMKVVDAILLLFHEMGYTGDMVDVPINQQVQLFASSREELNIEPATPLMDLVIALAADYLGGFLVFDPNAGDYGRWRVLLRKHAPYRILARFDPNHPGDMKLAHRVESYGTSTLDGFEVPHVPILNGEGIESPSFTIEPPEGNVVMVTGGVDLGNSAATQSAARLQQIAVNYGSFNALGLDTEHPYYPQPGIDFLGEMVPIEVFDITLNTQEAVNWVCRRVFDYACYGREVYTFTSPLVFVWDPDDDFQLSARPLRVQDAVQVKQRDGSWKTYIVSSVKMDWKRDNLQLATYELVYTSRIDHYAIPLGKFSSYDFRKGITGMTRVDSGMPRRARQRFAGQRAVAPNHSKWAGLPEVDAPKIQFIDPDSPSFGQFYFMAGYDPA